MAVVSINTFPYSEDDLVAPYTDGLLESDPVTSIFLAPLGSRTTTHQAQHKLSGQFCQEYIGGTSMIFATRVWYPQIAGDS
jgi:hypothetical protein